jgi:tetratricopeptide (TPR) repeat protein
MAWFQLGLMAVDVGKMGIAAQMIAKASECRPVEMTYHRALTEIYRRLGDLDKALHHGKQATKHGDNDADSFYNYGLALADDKRFEEAIEAYKKAVHLNPQYGLAYNNLGSAYENIDDEDSAFEAYKKAIEINPMHAEAQHNLGAILNQRGQNDEAKECYIKAINANPNFTYAHHSLSTLKTYAEDDPHLEMLENLAQQTPQMDHEMQTKFWFALGKARSDVKKYGEAFEAYDMANKLHRQTFPYNVEDTRRTITAITAGFDKDFIKKETKGFNDETPIFILGMPRSGSTLIEQILDSHSQIHGAGELKDLSEIVMMTANLEEEATYIDWLKNADEDVLQEMGQRYIERLRQHSDGALRIVDKMPSNFFYVGLIHKILPNAKIIHSLRDPMDICISNYTRMFKQIMPFAYEQKELGQYCRLCHDMMDHWRDVLPEGVIYTMEYEALVDDLESKARELIDFCGLEWEESCLGFYKNKRVVKTASHNQVNKPIYKTSVKRWKKYENYIQLLIDGYDQ